MSHLERWATEANIVRFQDELKAIETEILEEIDGLRSMLDAQP